MVIVSYVDGDEDTFELNHGTKVMKPWEYLKDEQAYLIQSIEGDVVIPAGFIKRLKHIEVDND